MQARQVWWAAALVVGACSGGSEGSSSSSSSGNAGGTDAGSSGTADAGMTVDCSNRPSASPSVRSELAGVLDAANNRLVFFGGNTAVAMACNVPGPSLSDQVWAFHLDCNSWEELLPATRPTPRARAGYAWDGTRNRMLLFAGRERPSGSYRNLNDLWAYDLASDVFSQLQTTGTPPPPRSSPVMVVDAVKDRLVVFGGNTSTSSLTLTGTDDMYALDLQTLLWSLLEVPNRPSERLYHSAVVVGREMVVYGGTPNFNGPFLQDTHGFNLDVDAWHRISATGPEARFGAEIFADPARNRIFMFGGHDGAAFGNRNDVWAQALDSGTWSAVHSGDALGSPPNGQCDFPPDFTLPQEGAPERRYSFVRMQSETDGYIFAGKTDCGAASDVWKISLETGAWTQLRPSTGGVACNRSGATTCTSLCF